MAESYEGFPAVVLRSDAGIEATYAPAIGMVGCSLRHEGAELLGQRGGLARYEATGSTFGIPFLHPWANRLDGLVYETAGKRVELDPESPMIRTDPNGLPIHGALAASPHWRIVEQAPDRLTAALDYGAHPELLEVFPFPHELRMDVQLSGTKLAVETTLTPTADTAVPVSFGYHPYLRLPDVTRAEWIVEMPVTEHLRLDARGIPTGEAEPAREQRAPLGDRAFDDAYAGLESPPVFALEGGGRRLEVTFGEGYPFAQVYAPPDQELICFEPMTAPTNALVSGRDLPLVQPGGQFSASFSITVSAL